MRLFMIRDNEEHPALVLGTRPQSIGRSPHSDLVLLRERTVSTDHATVWLEHGDAHIRDLGSRNGTWLNGDRVREAKLVDGDRILIGSVQFVARGAVSMPEVHEQLHMLEDVGATTRYPFAREQLVLGPLPHADVLVECDPDDELILTRHQDGSFSLSGRDIDLDLALQEEFQLAARRFRIVEVEVSSARTQDIGAPRPQYALQVRMDPRTGPQATLTDLEGAQHPIKSETRATLLYLLAKARLDPTNTGGGWLTDSEAGVGIWGKQGGHDARKLHVLIHRLRKQLRDLGLDPWFIEKRRRAVRLVLEDVELR